MIVPKIVGLLSIFFITYFLKMNGIFERKYSEFISGLLIYLVVPAVVIKSFTELKLRPDLVYLPLSALIVVSGLLVAGFVISRILDLPVEESNAFRVTLPTLEAGTIGYTFMLAVYGQSGLSRIVLFDFANALFLFTVVYYVTNRLGDGSHHWKDSAANILKSPLVWAIPIGLLFNLMNFHNPLVFEFLEIASGGLLLLVMVLLGLTFEFEDFSLKFPALTLGLKALMAAALAFLSVKLFGLTGLSRKAVIIGSLLPPSIITVVFAEENNLETEKVSEIVSTGLIVSLVLLPLLMTVL